MASSRSKNSKTKAKKVKTAKVVNTDIKKEIIEILLKKKQEEHHKKLDFIKKVKNSLQIETKKITELEGAILALHELLTGEKVN